MQKLTNAYIYTEWIKKIISTILVGVAVLIKKMK
jgi:hypothetical protein